MPRRKLLGRWGLGRPGACDGLAACTNHLSAELATRPRLVGMIRHRGEAHGEVRGLSRHWVYQAIMN